MWVDVRLNPAAVDGDDMAVFKVGGSKGRHTGGWCNGNTTGFGSVIAGSTPAPLTKRKRR